MFYLGAAFLGLVSSHAYCDWSAIVEEDYHGRTSNGFFALNDDFSVFRTQEVEGICRASKLEKQNLWGFIVICTFKNFKVLIPAVELSGQPPIEGESFIIADDGTQIYVRLKCKRKIKANAPPLTK